MKYLYYPTVSDMPPTQEVVTPKTQCAVMRCECKMGCLVQTLVASARSGIVTIEINDCFANATYLIP